MKSPPASCPLPPAFPKRSVHNSNRLAIDTCVLSEYTKKNPNFYVINWLDFQNESGLFISILSIAEIKKGIVRIEDSQSDRANKLRIWVEKLQTRFIDRILPLDEKIWIFWTSGEKCSICYIMGANKSAPTSGTILMVGAYGIRPFSIR